MDLKEFLCFRLLRAVRSSVFCAILLCAILTPVSSAPVVIVTRSPHEAGLLQLSTDSDKCKNAEIAWEVLAAVLGVFVVGVVIFCICLVKCRNRRSSEEHIGILSKEVLPEEYEQIQKERDFFEVRGYRENVTLDPITAHPRLQVSEDGKCVRDTGNVLRVPNSEERFDSHMFVLAKEDFTEGKHYWEVEVGQKKSWDLGVASESVSRKGKITLAPQNGYWVIGLDGNKDYWARTDPWTRLRAIGKPMKIGIFLDMSRRQLSFYDVNRKSELYTFTIRHFGTLYPFFSLGSVATELDSQQLKILNESEE